MQLQKFEFENSEIRVLTDENEQSWFVGVDLGKALNYTMPSNVIKENLDEDERKLTNVEDGSGQQRKTWIVNEFGLYSLILSSSKPEAKAFKRWVTHEVLPSLRKAGKYSTLEEQQHELKLQKIASDIQKLKDEKDHHQKKVNKLKKKIDELTIEMITFIKKERGGPELPLEFPKN